MVKCEGSPLCYSKRWRLFSRLAGDASLLLSMTYAWGGWDSSGFYPSEWQRSRGRQPFVIPSAREESRAICLRFFTTLTLHSEWHHTVKVASLGYVISNACERSHTKSLGWRCFAIAQHDRHLAGDSSSLRSSEWQALARDSSKQSLSRR